MQLILSCRGISKSYGDRIVLNNIDLDVKYGDRIGIVGRNGSGKSTLADILAGRMDYDGGHLAMPKMNLRIGYLQQNETVSSFSISDLQGEPWSGESQQLYKKLGIIKLTDFRNQRWENLSGGERSKLALAEIWKSNPDLLILDEPTNHLDYQGLEWMVKELTSFKGVLILISHDRYFLDRTVSTIIQLDKGKAAIYPGNYTDYRHQKEKEAQKQRHDFETQQKEQHKLEDSIDQLKNWSDKAHRDSRKKALKSGNLMGGKEYYRAKAKKRDKAIKSKLQRLEKQRQASLERPQEELQVSFDFIQAIKRGKRLLQAENLSKSYPRLALFSSSSFYVNRGEKIGVFGPNGCGKTTLFKLILGQEQVDEGKIFLSSSARTAYVSQELTTTEDGTVLKLLKDMPSQEQKRILNLLAKLGINYERCQIDIHKLSQGEHMKVKLGLALMGEYDLLMLDEPTNHLDLPSREALEKSLVNHWGSILIISHDRYLLEQVCDHMLIFDNGQIRRIEGSVGDYLNSTAKDIKPHSVQRGSSTAEHILLLEMRISFLISEIARFKPGDAKYTELDDAYRQLMHEKQQLMAKKDRT